MCIRDSSYILLGEPVGSGASYTLGKFVTPDLYISYERDIFEKINTFSIRYTINNRLTFIATSSRNQGGDLLYTFER